MTAEAMFAEQLGKLLPVEAPARVRTAPRALEPAISGA